MYILHYERYKKEEWCTYVSKRNWTRVHEHKQLTLLSHKIWVFKELKIWILLKAGLSPVPCPVGWAYLAGTFKLQALLRKPSSCLKWLYWQFSKILLLFPHLKSLFSSLDSQDKENRFQIQNSSSCVVRYCQDLDSRVRYANFFTYNISKANLGDEFYAWSFARILKKYCQE